MSAVPAFGVTDRWLPRARRAKNTAIGSHAGPVGSNTTASVVPADAPASAARSSAVKDSTVGTHDDRHTTRPSAPSTRTECRDAIPRSIPASRRTGGCPASSCSTRYLSSTLSELPAPAAQQAATLRPRSHGARAQQRLPFMCCNGPMPSELGHFPHPGHPWPGQQWQSNPRGPDVTGLRTFVVAIYRTSRGCSCNPGTPARIKRRNSLHEPATP